MGLGIRSEAGLEGRHQIDDLALRRLLARDRDLLALDLAVDQLAHPLALGVLVNLGMELLGRHLGDELDRQLELWLLDLGRADGHFREGAQLVGVAELLHDEPLFEGAEQDKLVLAASTVAAEGCTTRCLHRLGDQAVRPVTALVRAEIPGLLEVDRIYRFEGEELGDLDGVGGLGLEYLELLLGEQDVLPLGVLVPLSDAAFVHQLIVHRADVLLAQPRAAALVHHIELDTRRRLARGVELDGDADQAEGDSAGGEGAGTHKQVVYSNEWLRVAKKIVITGI